MATPGREPGAGNRLPAPGFLAVAVLTATVAVRAGQAPAPIPVTEKVYTKAQAEKGDTAYKKICIECHALGAGTGTGKEEGPPLAGDAFLTKWDGKTVHELAISIRLNMPPDGSVTIGEEDAADLIAFILRSNGFPEGDRALKADASAKGVVIVKGK